MSRNIFIHFLNRELLRSLMLNRIEGVNYVLKILLLAKDSSLYVPLSSVWENLGSSDLDYNFLFLVYYYQQLEIIADCVTQEEFLEKNLKLYFYDKERYGCYFDDYQKYLVYRPTVIKNQGATKSIRNRICLWEKGENILYKVPEFDCNILNLNKKIICEINENNNEKGITKSLFKNSLIKNIHEYPLARLLSFFYIQDYQHYIDGDIATGVSRKINYYDNFALEYPYNDITILSTILKCVGLDEGIINNERYDAWRVFLSNRCSAQHERICSFIEEIIRICIHAMNVSSSKTNINIYSNGIKSYINKVSYNNFNSMIKIISINQFDTLEENLRNFVNVISNFDKKNDLVCLKGDSLMVKNKNIFVVHGHNELLKENVVNWLFELELKPIVLSNSASGGINTIISKIEMYSNVDCAIALFTADDKGKSIKDRSYKYRARQNVIFETGYFIGKLSPKRVVILYEKGVEIPSDLEGCIYILADENGGWKEKVRKELNTMGIDYKK